MSFDTGIFTDLDDANSIQHAMTLVRAKAIKLPPALGKVWEDAAVEPDPDSNRKFDTYSRTETQRAGTIGTGGWDISATTALPVTSSVGLIKGLVIQIEDEIVVVDEITSATVITVRERGTAGTTAATHAAAVAYTLIGSAIDDVDLKDISSVHEITNLFQNFMQTLAEPIDYTKGGLIDDRKGLSKNQIAILQEEAMMRVARNVYATSINGRKQQKAANKPWMTAGLLQQLSDTTDGRLVLRYNCNGVLTEAKLKAALRTVFERGAPTDIYCSSANKDTINEFLAASAATKISVNTEMVNNTAGYHVDSYNYEGNFLNIKIDLSMPNDRIAILNMAKVKKGWKKGDALVLEKQPTLSTREDRDAYNGSFFFAVEDVGYEHIDIYGVTQS